MIVLNSHIILKLLDLFYSHEGESFYVNEIVRRIGADKRNIVKKLKELENEGLFSVEPLGNMKLYSLDKKFPLYNEYKKIVLRTFGFDKKLKSKLEHVHGISKAYIYGSYARNKMDTSSDIDVLIVGSHDVIEVQKRIAELQKEYDREINIINMSNEEFQRKQNDPFIRDIMKNAKIDIL